MRFASFLLLSLATACGAPRSDQVEPAAAEPVAAPERAPREGITVEHVQGPPPAGRGDGTVTLVRIDLRRYRPVLVTAASRDGRFRSLPEWARDEGMVAAINASLFEPDGRPSGLLVQDGVERSPDDARFGGLFAFDPFDPGASPAVAFAGRECASASIDALRARYRSVVANYRMLDCEGAPITWADERAYGSAAFGLDREGALVLVHARSAYRMRDLARFLAESRFGLVHLQYVEGGPKATLFVDDGGGAPLVETGRHAEDADDRDHRARPIPNVLGVVPRAG